MKSEKILNTIPKLQQLNDKELDLISSAINSCLVVKAMEKVSRNPLEIEKIISLSKSKEEVFN